MDLWRVLQIAALYELAELSIYLCVARLSQSIIR